MPSPEPQTPLPGVARILRPDAAARWMGWRVKDYTPDRIETLLRDAMIGDVAATWEMFWLMEDTWPRLAKALAEVKRAAVQMEWRVEPWAEDDAPATDEATRKARLVSHALWTMRPRPHDGGNGFQATVFDLLDAWGKGLTVLEVVWEPRETTKDGTLIAPQATHWVDPKHYAWHEGELRLRQPGSRGVMEWPADRFLIGLCKARTGPLSAVALLRPLAWWWCASNFSAAWLLNLAQVFGLPIRWATYPQGAPQHLVDQICAMLENMGSSAWGAFPAGASIELKEPSKGSGSWPQDGLLDRADKQVDLLILGQTLTTDVGDSGSRALGGVHRGVLDEIKQAAADWAATVINQQLIPSICRLNWGDELEMPEICPKPADQRDLAAEANRFTALQAAGMRIPRKWAHEMQQVPIPAEGEDVLEVSKPAAMALPGFGGPEAVDRPEDPEDETEPPEEADPEETAPEVDAARVDPPPATDPVAEIAARKAKALAEVYRGSLAPVRRLVELSTSREDLQTRLREYYADWSPGRAAALAAEAFEIMAAAGAVAATERPRG